MRSRILIVATTALAIWFSLIVYPVDGSGQATMPSEAPVAWQRYKAGGRSESILLPKLPTVKEDGLFCSDMDALHYFAYAEDVVYEFTIFYKGDLMPSECKPTRLGRHALNDRLKEIRGATPPYSESRDSTNGLDRYIFANDLITRWVISDLANNRWIELAIHHRPGAKVDASKFTGSLDLSSGQGKDIGEGADVTLGDAGVDTSVMSPSQRMQDPVDPNTEPFRVISKPRAAYTEQARMAGIQGSVSLKIVFLANGGIGPITVASDTLKGRLSEQTIAAAHKIVFLPKKVNGVPVSTTASFQYHFTLY